MCSTKDVFFSSTTSFPSYDSDASDATRRDAFHLQSYGVSIASSRARGYPPRTRSRPPRVCQNRPPVTLPIPVIPKLHRDAQSGSSTQYSLARFGSSAGTRSNRLASDAAGEVPSSGPPEGKRAKDSCPRGGDGGGADVPSPPPPSEARPSSSVEPSASSASRSSMVLS